jgi:membrane-bound lytic murein transglycosylase D
VDVDRMTSLPVLARYADTDVEALRELNPELLRGTTPPGRYALRVPPGQSGAAARALARIPASQRLDFKAYRLRKGDTLARVAARFNLSQEDLLVANGITRAQFRPGRTIKVPPPPATPIDDRDLLTQAQRERTIESRPLENLPAIPGAGATAPLEKPAETEAAPLEPVAEPAPRPAAGAHAHAEKPAPRPAPEPRVPAVHVVKRGETLFAIAERYNLEVSDLRKLNRLRKSAIVPGQRLKLRK